MPGTIEAILLLLLLVIPGATCLWLTRSAIPAVLSGQHQFFVFATMAGVIVQFVSMPATIAVWEELLLAAKSFRMAQTGKEILVQEVVVFWVIAVFFVIPAVLAQLFSFVLECEGAQPILTLFGKSKVQLTPLSWDWFYCTQQRGCWIVAEMNDGTLVGGPYGENSFASLSPHSKDLYLEEAYFISQSNSDPLVGNLHDFGGKISDTIGVWINADNAKALYFYRVEGGDGG